MAEGNGGECMRIMCGGPGCKLVHACTLNLY